jgi:hypothetical protein
MLSIHYSYEQSLYRNILDNSTFDLDRDGFHGNNDLQVNIASQTGGLHSVLRLQGTQAIPNNSEFFHNYVYSNELKKYDQNVFSELDSPQIQQDVIILLNSPTCKFANAIGVGSMCYKITVSR